MKCPNGDPAFYPAWKMIAGNASPQTREYLFWFGCIPFRLFILYLLFKWHDHWWVPYVVGILAFVAMTRMTRMTSRNIWWSRPFQAIMAFTLVVASVLVLAGKCRPIVLPFLWFVSVFCGMVQNLVTPIC